MKTKKGKIKKLRKSDLIKSLDTVTSILLRLKYSDEHGIIYCFTCHRQGHVSDGRSMQCGHYVSRGVESIRFDFDNIRPQCFVCNGTHGGNLVEYELRLINQIGKDRVNQLNEIRNNHINFAQDYRFSKDELADMIENYYDECKKTKKLYLLTEYQRKILEKALSVSKKYRLE